MFRIYLENYAQQPSETHTSRFFRPNLTKSAIFKRVSHYFLPFFHFFPNSLKYPYEFSAGAKTRLFFGFLVFPTTFPLLPITFPLLPTTFPLKNYPSREKYPKTTSNDNERKKKMKK